MRYRTGTVTTWIFQATPDRFDVGGYLASQNPISWTVRQAHFVPEIRIDDRVFLWRAQGSGDKEAAGIVGSGVVLEEPIERPDDEAARPFWRDAADAGEILPRVRIRVDKVAASIREVLKRKWLLEEPSLRSLPILKMASGTNFRISEHDAERLENLWQNTGRDWNDAESTAGLYVYAKTYGGTVSTLDGSPVVIVAHRIGRAVTGVYNKVMNFRSIDPRDNRDGLSGASETDKRVWIRYYTPSTKQLDEGRLEADYQRLWGLRVDVADPEVPIAADEASISERAPALAGRGQGYEQDPLVRAAIEARAMEMAESHYRRLCYDVTNTSATQPFDLRCTRDSQEVRVEVKGTRGDGSTIEVTSGEVESARGMAWRTDLVVVSHITVERLDMRVVGSGGTMRIVEGWRPVDDDLTPTRFRCRVG